MDSVTFRPFTRGARKLLTSARLDPDDSPFLFLLFSFFLLLLLFVFRFTSKAFASINLSSLARFGPRFNE